MKKLIRKMKKFSERHLIDGCSLLLEDDETGYVEDFETRKILFEFQSMKELKLKLAKTYEPERVFERLHEN